MEDGLLFTVKKKRMQIVERTPGISDYGMWQYCELLCRVMGQMKELKTGRGAKIETTWVYKYKDAPEILPRLQRSRDYYKELHEKGGCQVEFRQYQKDIIDSGSTILKAHHFFCWHNFELNEWIRRH